MIARIATFEGVNVDEARRGWEKAEAAVRPLLEGMPGFSGYLDLLSPEGNFLSITMFDTEENAQAAEQTFDEEMPRALGEIFKSWEGHRTSVAHYAVVGDSRV
jgi:hypothetical protein